MSNADEKEEKKPTAEEPTTSNQSTSNQSTSNQSTSKDSTSSHAKSDAKFSQHDYHHPAAAWGAAWSVGNILLRQNAVVDGVKAIFNMNQENGGFDCPGCAWPDDRKGLKMDICENGIKHVTWEMTKKRVDREFFAKYSVTELMGWSEFQLEDHGRLTEPMAYNAKTDHYEPISWKDAFALMGRHLNALQSPNEASFYTSGRLSNEGTFLYQLFARELGTNNLPDCSNMCHEASGRALQASIGTGKGTVDIDDWQHADAVFVLGVNAATNAPRMLSALVDGVKEHGTKIVHINPLVEVAATKAITPHEVLDMLTFRETATSTLNLQPRTAGDMAIMRGIAKYLLEAAKTDPKAIDTAFIRNYTSGFEEYKKVVEATSWQDLAHQSGVSIEQIKAAGEIARQAHALIISWCLGISQQEFAVDTIREIMNIQLLGGHIGRPGAGPCPIRGHSNVQGNRTCGIANRPKEEWLARMDTACGITSPREHGVDTIRTIEGMYKGTIKFFFGLGGNFAIATPDTKYTFEALRRCPFTAHVSTKLNRSHLVHGKEALILPCLGRTEIDRQKAGPQEITVEDSMSMVHLSRGMKEPASEHLLSELAIVAGLARATMPNSKTPWEEYISNYDNVRDKMADAIEGFEDFNNKVRKRLGFRLRQPARELMFLTDTGKANFSAAPLPDVVPPAGKLTLGTMRSHDQFNTTIYSDNDRYRGVKNLRTLLLMNEEDMKDRGLKEFDLIDITSFAKDGSTRKVTAFRAVRYNISRGCTSGYMPELNVLLAIGEYSRQSDQPSMKQILVEVTKSSATDGRTAAAGNGA